MGDLGLRETEHRYAKPEGCREVAPGDRIEDTVRDAPEGSALCLAPGEHRGPLHVTKRITIWGPREARIVSSGTGTTVEVRAPGTRLVGFTVDGSGGRYDTDDAAIKVHSDDVTVEGVSVVHATFGILVERVKRARIVRNRVQGNPATQMGLRGDAIRLWETTDSVVEANHVTHARDMVFWYSSRNRLLRNVVEGGRYGTHLMYSHDNRIEGNRFLGSIVGTFVMYSHDVVIRGNQYVDMSTPAGMGVGLKESSDIRVESNSFVHCNSGLYVDTSPLGIDSYDHIDRNDFALNDAAVVFHGTTERNLFRRNVLRSNREQVRVEGGNDALGSDWKENHFDDYRGYDLNSDGIGDVPYEERSLAGQLESDRPNLAFFHGTPARAVVDALGQLVPLFAPRLLVVDARPLVARPGRGGAQ